MKGISKTACKPYLTPRRVLDVECGLLHTGQIDYVICSAIHIVDHRKLLILDLYPRAEAAQGIFKPRYTVFQATDTFLTYGHHPDAKTKWRTAMLDNLERNYNFTGKCAFYCRQDEERVIRFCKTPGWVSRDTGFLALYRKQSALRDKSTRARNLARQRKIRRRMQPLRPVSESVKRWAQKEVLPQYIFYNYQRTTKPVSGKCTACGGEVEIIAPRHNKTGVCSACGAAVIFKSRGRQKYIWDRASVQILQRVSEHELVLRILKAHFNYRDGNADYTIYESIRWFIRWDEGGVKAVDKYYNSHDRARLTPWKSGIRPRFSCYQECFEGETCSHLYTKNLPQVLSDTPWKYCQLGAFYLSDKVQMDVLPYLQEYLRQPFIEYFVKLGLHRLAAYVVYEKERYSYFRKECAIDLNGKSFQSVLCVGKEYLPMLQRLNASYHQLELLQGMLRLGIRPDERILEWCDRHNIQKLHDLLVPLGHTTPHKLMRYVEQQYQASGVRSFRRSPDFSGTLSDYRDYLCMCEGLEYDLHNSFVLFPRSLKEAHDAVCSLSDNAKSSVYERQIRQAFPLLEKMYRYEKNGWAILAPRTTKEITDEGHKLHHCVGGYVRRVAMKECIVLFLRRASQQSKPFATIELVDNEVVQARGFDNASLTGEAQRFLEKWKRQVLHNSARNSLFTKVLDLDTEDIAA